MTRRQKRQQKLNRDINAESEAAKRQKMCGNKKQYDSDLKALAWGREANDRYNQNKEWDTYYCPYCRHRHLTSVGE
jgi:hypothetical protein